MRRIDKLRATPHTKAMLMKARVLSVINYTGSIQTIPEAELDKWEKQIYNDQRTRVHEKRPGI